MIKYFLSTWMKSVSERIQSKHGREFTTSRA